MKPTLERVHQLLHYDPAMGQFTWRVTRGRSARAGQRAGKTASHGYIVIVIDQHWLYAHRLAWLYVNGEWPTATIDHINGDRADNRITNLRDVDNFVNQQNRRQASKRNRSSGLLGAYPHGSRWLAKIMVRRVLHQLGTFDTAEEAHASYVEAKRRLHEGCTI